MITFSKHCWENYKDFSTLKCTPQDMKAYGYTWYT